MVNLIVEFKLFIQLKSLVKFWELDPNKKISSGYRNHWKGLNSLFRKIPFCNPAINKLEDGGTNLVSIAKLLSNGFDGTLTPYSQNIYFSEKWLQDCTDFYLKSI